jgi:hypothetical protein
MQKPGIPLTGDCACIAPETRRTKNFRQKGFPLTKLGYYPSQQKGWGCRRAGSNLRAGAVYPANRQSFVWVWGPKLREIEACGGLRSISYDPILDSFQAAPAGGR